MDYSGPWVNIANALGKELEGKADPNKATADEFRARFVQAAGLQRTPPFRYGDMVLWIFAENPLDYSKFTLFDWQIAQPWLRGDPIQFFASWSPSATGGAE